MPDVQKALQAILKVIGTPGEAGPAAGGRRVVCISRDYGAGGDEVARLLAKRLGVDVYDHVVLNKLTQRLTTDAETMRAVETGASRVRDLWLYSLVTGQDLNVDHYKQHLVNIILSLGRTGGVILGRGAHLILANSGALRVRFTGTPALCAQRVAAAQGIDIAAAQALVTETNSRRGTFIWDTFHERLNDPHTFDLVINTDHITDNDKVVDMLIDAMNMVGPPAHAKA